MTSSSLASSVAYLGPEGTFAHAVAKSRFGKNHRLLPEPDIRGVFESVLDHKAGSGIVPLENSSGSWIYATIDLLIGHAEKIKITKEHSLDVELAFAGHKNGTVKRIYSHFAPLEHNARWLRSNHPHAEQISCASTAHAALKARADEHGAAITSRAAATIYGLDVLAFPLGADEENVTRFMQIALADGKAHHGKKTGLVLALKDTPGSLAKFLQPFERANLNLSAIVSRAVHGKPGSHRFFIEVDGSETETKISSAVEQAEASAISLVSLGNYSATAKLKG